MPPSGRKAKTRARRAPAAEAHDRSDVETPEAIVTPSRSSRKRARASDAVEAGTRATRRKTKDTRLVDREGTEGTELHEPSDDETEPAVPSETEIISHLRVAERHVNATEDFANDLLEGQEHIPGYGKIAGRDWTFIIRKVEVNIGRPEAQERLMADDGAGQTSAASSRTVVDIDLGPDRQVSRSHAVISYDSESMGWFIVVNGRNGLRIDNNLLKRGMKSYLRNGSVIEIANTQMAFITTATEESTGPVWDASVIKQTQKSSEDDDGEDDSRNGNGLYIHPPVRSTLQNSSMYGNDVGSGGAQPQQHRQPQSHTQRGTLQAMPGTPVRSQPRFNKSSPAANYSRGVMMESTESIDYAADNAKDLKPPHSYAQLIGMAILSTPEQQMTLSNIYKFIMDHYAFYRFNTGGWQNSIRHNLSLNKAFTKIARRTDEPGKGMKWMIEPTEFDAFVQQGMKGCRRPPHMPGTQSTFGSPSSPMNAARTGAGGSKREDDQTSPSQRYRPGYQAVADAYTPERASRRHLESVPGLGIDGDGPEYDYPIRTTPRNGLTAVANAAGSPPALYVHEDSRVGPLDTPFPLRPSQRLAPPSTLKRPSDFIQFSSPAPFWKMEGLIGSTPFKPYDLSPLKTPFADYKKDGEAKKEEDQGADEFKRPDSTSATDVHSVKRHESPVISSSSPPRPSSSRDGPEASPTTLSRPATAVAKTLSQLATTVTGRKSQETLRQESLDSPSIPEHEIPTPVPAHEGSEPIQSGLPQTQVHAPIPSTAAPVPPITTNYLPRPQPSVYSHPATVSNGYHDDGDDEGIDLAK